MKYLKLLRVKHYIKNILIFFPLIFAGLLLTNDFFNVVLGFISFSFMASVVYIINDIKDKEKDKAHSTKSSRPIASGKISVKLASVIAVILFVISIVFNLLACSSSLIPLIILILYFTLNLAYSLNLKNIPIIDIALLALFYVLRIYYGGALINVEISEWLYLTIMSASLYLSFGKRRGEYMSSEKNTRKVLKYYNKDFLDKFMYLSLTLTIIFYSLWTILQNIKYLPFTIPLLILIFMKYSLIVEGDSDGDPIEVLLKDKILILLSIVYCIMMVIVMI